MYQNMYRPNMRPNRPGRPNQGFDDDKEDY